MGENDDGPVATVSEAAVTLSVPSADETLVETAKNLSGDAFSGRDEGCGGDQGDDIMVEVLSSHVYVDGVGDEEGAAGDGDDMNEEVGGCESVEVGSELVREANSPGEMPKVEFESGPLGSLDTTPSNANAHDLEADKDSPMDCDDGAWTGGGCVDVERSSEQNQDVSVDRVEVEVNEEFPGRGLVQEAEEEADAVDDLESRKLNISKDEVGNPESREVVDFPRAAIELSDEAPRVSVEDNTQEVSEENVDYKKEVPENDAIEQDLPCENKDLISVAGSVHSWTVNNADENSSTVIIENQVADEVGLADTCKAEALQSEPVKAEATGSDGGLNSYSKNQQSNIETDDNGGPEANITSEISTGGLTALENEFGLCPNANIVDLNDTIALSVLEKSTHSQQEGRVVKAEVFAEVTEIDESDSENLQHSFQKFQLPEDNYVIQDVKLSVSSAVPVEIGSFTDNESCLESSQNSKVNAENETLEIENSIDKHSELAAVGDLIDEARDTLMVDADEDRLNSKHGKLGSEVLLGDDSAKDEMLVAKLLHRGTKTSSELTTLDACGGEAALLNAQNMELEMKLQGDGSKDTLDSGSSAMETRVDDEKASVSRDGAPSVDALNENSCLSEKDHEINAYVLSGDTEKGNFAHGETCSSAAQKDENLSAMSVGGITEDFDSEQKIDQAVRTNDITHTLVHNPFKLCTLEGDDSVIEECLPIENHTSSIPLESFQFPGEKELENVMQEEVDQEDQRTNHPVLEEIVIQVAVEISNSVDDSALRSQTEAGEAALDTTSKHDSGSVSDTTTLLEDRNQGEDEIAVSNSVELPDGDHINGAHTHDAKRYHEVENHGVLVQMEPSEACNADSSAPEAYLPAFEVDRYSKIHDDIVRESFFQPNVSAHEEPEIQVIGSDDVFSLSECEDESAAFHNSHVDLGAGHYGESVEEVTNTEQSVSFQGYHDVEAGRTYISDEQNNLEDSVIQQHVELDMGLDTEHFSSCAEQNIQMVEWVTGAEQIETIGDKNLRQDADFEDQIIDNEHFSLHEVQIIESEEQLAGSELPETIEMEIEEQILDSEQLSSTREKILKCGSVKPGNSARLPQATYELAPDSDGEFCVSDLVWGKVRSHPWWPGQIFDPSDSSEKAMKYYKKDCHFVAYFGDRTFAWVDASLLKPFCSHFAHIEKHSSSEAFQNAVNCALNEVSRRVELGLACSCVPTETYYKLRHQVIENTGIRQESSRREGVDKSTSVDSFEPSKLVDYINDLARFPSGGGDRLDLSIARAQLIALNRLKGYNQLSEFLSCGEVGDAVEIPLSEQAHSSGAIPSGSGRGKTQNGLSHKRKHNLKDSTYLRKKERSLSDLMGGTPDSLESEDNLEEKPSMKVHSKKRRALDCFTDDSTEHDKRRNIMLARVSQATSPSQRQSFKVGECISRVASQLTKSPSILKYSNDKTEFDVLDHDLDELGNVIVPAESSADEILSQLDLAARDPLRGYSFLNNIISFFYDYRNFVVTSGREKSSNDKASTGRKRKHSQTMNGAPETFEFDEMNDSYWTDRVIQNSSEQPSRRGRKRKTHHSVIAKPEGCCLYGNYEIAVGRPPHDLSPTELILSFPEMDSVPSEMDLNKIFRRFGPLREFETEVDVLTSRARVVFKRCSDAEVAFTSAGAFKIFGATVVNYELSYSPSMSFKSAPLAITEGHEDVS